MKILTVVFMLLFNQLKTLVSNFRMDCVGPFCYLVFLHSM